MVDSVSGKMAPLPGRQGVQVSGGREPVDGRVARPEPTGISRPVADPRGKDGPSAARPGNGPNMLSEGRATVRSMAAEAPVDGARVAALREAIAGGRLRIDPDRIADAMLRSEPGLPRT
jgi:flagellar biosynthesis anti-sigma factor FlgM